MYMYNYRKYVHQTAVMRCQILLQVIPTCNNNVNYIRNTHPPYL